MSGALGGFGEFNMELLWRNRFCQGVKRGGEYVCGGETDENAVNKVVELLGEAVGRILKWRVWEAWWVVEAMDEWLTARDRLEVQLRGKYGDEVVNAITGLVDKFIGYNEQFLNYWREVGDEAKELIEDLMSGRAEVIIWEGEKGISVHREYITLEAHRTSTGGVTVHLMLNELEGVDIEVPDVFKKTMSKEEYERFINEVLKALEGGFEEADGFVKDGYAAMNTTQVWQAIVWSLLYPGEDYVHVKAVNVNEGGLTITWRLRTNHDPLKGRIFNDVEKLGEEELLAFTFTAVLGDGYADVEELKINGRVYDEAVIAIAMSGEKFKRWEPLLEKLKGMGFNWGSVPINNSVINVRFYSGNAINLARAMINVLPPILKDILDALGFDKWVRIRRIAEMEVKFRRGEMRITVAGYGFTVHVQKGTVELEHCTKSDVEVDEVINALKAVYGNGLQARVNTRKSGKYRVVTIPMHVFERYEDIKAQVVKVLCRKLERVKDERKKQIITKHLRRLTPTKGAVAVEHPNRESTQANPGNQNL